jgi:lipopolysaccharide/colanic/teichoic acid biosynthesis glycosyltransferase
LNIYPILLDSRPAWAPDTPAASLLMLPLGSGTLLEHLRERLRAVTPTPPVVFANLDVSDAYVATLRRVDPSLRSIVGPADFVRRLEAFEPSDLLLVVDPTCLPVTGLDPESLLRHPVSDSRWARHLVALENSADGTRECVDFDTQGRVRRIQRFYDSVTWPFTAGVSCSLVPAASTLLARGLPWTSLAELRQALATRGIPSRDLPIPDPVVNLGREEDVLVLNEHFLAETLPVGRRGGAAGVHYVGTGQRVDPSARLLGAVIVQDGAIVEAGATVLGPALIGARARVGRGALVAQSVLASGACVADETTLRHRVLFDGPAADTRSALPHRAPMTVAAPVLQRDEAAAEPLYESLKPVLESAVSIAALLLLSPLLLLVALIVKLDSRGPVLYGHKREGKDGRLFRCWKFRTMVEGAQTRERDLQAKSHVDGPQFKVDNDPRITRAGRWLRPTSLDELPQLLNVALGQMSLVGPRPSPFRENQLCVPWREGRLSVRPGITGLWQVCRHERASGDFHQWIQYDLLYVRYNSFLVDLKIMIATVLTGGGKGHVPLSWILPASQLEGEA